MGEVAMERGPLALFGAIVAVGLGPALWLGVQFGNVDVPAQLTPPAVSEQTPGSTELLGGTGAGDPNTTSDDQVIKTTPRGDGRPASHSPSRKPSPSPSPSDPEPSTSASSRPSDDDSPDPSTSSSQPGDDDQSDPPTGGADDTSLPPDPPDNDGGNNGGDNGNDDNGNGNDGTSGGYGDDGWGVHGNVAVGYGAR
jgi:hypothetical protein